MRARAYGRQAKQGTREWGQEERPYPEKAERASLVDPPSHKERQDHQGLQLELCAHCA